MEPILMKERLARLLSVKSLVTLALTAGEKGAPVGADIEEYRRSKIREAEAWGTGAGC